MSIKMRLVFSYIAMTFIPVVLFALIAGSLSSFFFKDASAPHGGFGFPSLWETSKQRDELVAGVKFMAQTDPDRFTDSHFLKNTDEQLNHWQAGLVVKKDDQMTYVSPYVNTSDLADKLRALRTEPDQSPWSRRWNNRSAAEKFEITFSDHSAGTVYVLSDANTFFQNARLFFPLLVLSLLIVIGLTNGILTFLVSRSFIQPLYKLKHAAVQIKEGNLDHEVKLNRKDEIGELGAVFEEMRSRLKESIRLQLQYEENRKELVSNISHDLKTPITGIKACLEGIRDGIADTGPKREKYMNMIAKKTEEMDRLIDELMLYSKLDLNRLPFHLEPVELAAYLRDCVEEFSVDPRMEGTQITFTNVTDRPITVLADREKLHRVLLEHHRQQPQIHEPGTKRNPGGIVRRGCSSNGTHP